MIYSYILLKILYIIYYSIIVNKYIWLENKRKFGANYSLMGSLDAIEGHQSRRGLGIGRGEGGELHHLARNLQPMTLAGFFV